MAYKEFAQHQVNSLFVRHQSEAFVRAIIKLKNNPALYQKLSRNGIKLREKFSWPEVTAQLEILLARIAKTSTKLNGARIK